MHKRQSTENLFNRILHRRRQQLTNHTTADNIDVSCNEIILIPSQTNPTARKILCKPRAFNENRSKQNQSISYPVYNNKENENVHPSPFLNSSSLLMTMLRYQKLGKNPFSILSPKNYIEDKPVETVANSKLVVEDNSIQNITKFGNVILDKYDTEEDKWLLDNETTTGIPFLIDLKSPQPLKSGGIAIQMNSFLQFGEIGIIMYPVLYKKF